MADMQLAGTTLPQGYTVRPPKDADIPAIIALLRADDEAFASDGAMEFTADDIRSDWQGIDRERDAWLILAPDGQVAGYEVLSDHGSGHLLADGNVHPMHKGLGVGSALMDRMEARAHEVCADMPEGVRVTLELGVMPEDAAARQMMDERGFEHVRTFWRMRVDLAEQPPAPQWPNGITLRAFEVERDGRAVFDTAEEAFADHWGHVPQQYEEWSARFERSDFDPTLIFLAIAEGEELAGVALCRQQPDQGWVNTLAVRRAWRKRGLGKALLLHAFGEFYRRGERRIGLGVDAQSLTGATRLYESVGMRPVMTIYTYTKELRAGEDMRVQALH